MLLVYACCLLLVYLTSCDFPDSWKHIVVYPIFKSSDPSVIISNYRPFSEVPIMAKELERVLQRQLSAYMLGNYLHSSSLGICMISVPTIQNFVLFF